MRTSMVTLAAFAFLLAGCVTTDLRITNRTGTGIYIYSGHTKKITSVAADATAAVPHTSGRVIVITQRDEVWQYDDIRSLGDEAIRGYKRVSLPLDIEPDGRVIWPSGKTLTPTQRLMR